MTPIRVGLVGTGYAAKLRATAFTDDARSQLVLVAGHQADRTANFAQGFGAIAVSDWRAIVERSDIDLVVVATVNRDHGAIVRAALEAQKAVVVEYPLAIDLQEAEALVALAQQQQCLLHVEHVELLSGIHQVVQRHLPDITPVVYGRYVSLNAQHPAPQKWTYHPDLFGFPLMAATSRIHRLTNLLGPVASVSCQTEYRYRSPLASSDQSYATCLCAAQLRFATGSIVEVVYGKGESIWQSARTLELHGDQGAILIDGDRGLLVRQERSIDLDLGTRRGLFAKDTQAVLAHLLQGTPLYVSPTASLYALRVADAARRSAESGQTIKLHP